MTKKIRLPLFAKLVITFLLLTAVILGVLWLVQIGLFDSVYRSVTASRLNGFQQRLEGASPEEFEALVQEMGESDNVCTGIYSVGRSSLSLVADYHTQSKCFVHSIRNEHILYLYRLALKQENKHYQTSLSGEQIDQYFPDKNNAQTVIIIDGTLIMEPIEQFRPGSGQSSDTLLSVFLTEKEGADYFCMMSTTLIPANAAGQTLKVQLEAVTALALVLSLLLSLILARTLSVPLSRLNHNSAALPSGNFKEEDLGGCREIAQLEKTLSLASEEIKKVDSLQKELIANVSHDLKTPLTLIKSYSELMQDMPQEITRENLQVIIDESSRLSSLVNDMLNNSKLEAGIQTLSLSSFDLSALCRDIVGRIRAFMEPKGYTLHWEGEEHLWVDADELKLGQVIYNLIGNAVNFTGEDKTVWIRLHREGNSARLEVRDSGEGIPAEHLDQIWNRYYKVPHAHRREQIGSGLGLSISKKVLELHHFPYGATSKEGEGSCFWLEAPLKKDREL